MPGNPRVSVCVSAFNAGQYLSETLESLLAQSFGDFEVIIVDDGSADNTADVAEQFVAKDSRVRLLRNSNNKGLVFTRNRALAESRGEFVAIADADDISEPNRLAVQVSYLDANPEIGMLGSDVALIDESGALIGSHAQQYHLDREIRFFLMFGPCLHNPTTIYRRDLLKRVGGYANGYDAGAEDYELWGRLLDMTRIANIPQLLVMYRKHSRSVTADRSGVDANIFSISAELLSKYLGNPVEGEQARRFHFWLMKQGMEAGECREALSFAKAIWQCASLHELPDTLAILGDSLAVSAWAHAQYMVYADRRLSLDLARFASSLPHSSPQAGAISYAGRLAVPNAIRSFLKSLSGRT
jgi:glycosyltransferase involved in cell wall biosynthesis